MTKQQINIFLQWKLSFVPVIKSISLKAVFFLMCLQEWLCFATQCCAWKAKVFVFSLHLWGARSPSVVQCHLREPEMTFLQKSIELGPLTLQIQRFTQAVCLVIFSIDVLWQKLYFYRNMLFPVMDVTQQFKWLDYINLFQKKNF